MSAAHYTAARARRLILKGELPVGAVVDGDLDLRGCDLTGITLPTTIGDSLYLSGCDLTGITTWWQQNGEQTRRRCIAVSDYALIQLDDGTYTAGCRGRDDGPPYSAKKALAHWGSPRRGGARAKAFVAAIKQHRLVQ